MDVLHTNIRWSTDVGTARASGGTRAPTDATTRETPVAADAPSVVRDAFPPTAPPRARPRASGWSASRWTPTRRSARSAARAGPRAARWSGTRARASCFPARRRRRRRSTPTPVANWGGGRAVALTADRAAAGRAIFGPCARRSRPRARRTRISRVCSERGRWWTRRAFRAECLTRAARRHRRRVADARARRARAFTAASELLAHAARACGGR